jgi:electron-transferring-flavoprotein dehydrogenase
MEADVVCVGFGPAMGGFLTTLSRELAHLENPPVVICYERADDIGFGVSGVVTRARGIRATFPDLDLSQIPMAVPVAGEKVLCLLDPVGASRRSRGVRVADRLIRLFGAGDHEAIELPYTPEFLRKDGGLLLSIGQFNQWVGSQLMAGGAVQIWPGTPVAAPLIEEGCVVGVRLIDQGTGATGNAESGFAPGMDVRARLTVIGDGPAGYIGRQIDRYFGMPDGNDAQQWAVGMKMVVETRGEINLPPGTVLHTFGYPEPEIFGFFYVHPDRLVSVGIFVPSWFQTPVRTSYRYLQHYMMHPYLWRYLQGGTLVSWGAKSIQESGRRGEPKLVGPGYARIGEGSGSTNVLTGSGVDEAWTTGVLLAEGVLEICADGRPFTREDLEEAYVSRRRESWVEREALVAERARDGFHRGVIAGLAGMALAGLSGGRLGVPAKAKSAPSLEQYFAGRISPEDLDQIRLQAHSGTGMHDACMKACGWPEIPYDGRLLVSHQDALLMGGKVQAPAGYADHVIFVHPDVCEACRAPVCIEMCSGQALTHGSTAVPLFDREKCVFCGACLWNCPEGNIEFRAGAGGLHSAQN